MGKKKWNLKIFFSRPEKSWSEPGVGIVGKGLPRIPNSTHQWKDQILISNLPYRDLWHFENGIVPLWGLKFQNLGWNNQLFSKLTKLKSSKSGPPLFLVAIGGRGVLEVDFSILGHLEPFCDFYACPKIRDFPFFAQGGLSAHNTRPLTPTKIIIYDEYRYLVDKVVILGHFTPF